MLKTTATCPNWCIGMAFTCRRKWTARWRKGHRWFPREDRASIRSRHSRAELVGITHMRLPAKICAEVSIPDNLVSSISSRRTIPAITIKKFFSRRISGSRNSSACRTSEKGRRRTTAWKSCIDAASFNDKALGYGEPIRVKAGARVLFHLLNASATDDIRLALARTRFSSHRARRQSGAKSPRRPCRDPRSRGKNRCHRRDEPTRSVDFRRCGRRHARNGDGRGRRIRRTARRAAMVETSIGQLGLYCLRHQCGPS